jgi:hypothetical protein
VPHASHPQILLLHSCLPLLLHLLPRLSYNSSDDDDDIVPRGRLLEDYHRLALHTERQLRGEWVMTVVTAVVTDILFMCAAPRRGYHRLAPHIEPFQRVVWFIMLLLALTLICPILTRMPYPNTNGKHSISQLLCNSSNNCEMNVLQASY